MVNGRGDGTNPLKNAGAEAQASLANPYHSLLNRGVSEIDQEGKLRIREEGALDGYSSENAPAIHRRWALGSDPEDRDLAARATAARAKIHDELPDGTTGVTLTATNARSIYLGDNPPRTVSVVIPSKNGKVSASDIHRAREQLAVELADAAAPVSAEQQIGFLSASEITPGLQRKFHRLGEEDSLGDEIPAKKELPPKKEGDKKEE